MNKIGKTLTRHPKKILLFIFSITIYLFYFAFISDSRLEIDFSMEQMFPDNDPEKFLEEEISLRKIKDLPPFKRLIAFIISSSSEKDSFLEAQKIKKKLLFLKNVDILGPVTSPIFKIKNKYRTRLLLKSDSKYFIQKDVRGILKNLNISKKIKLTVDVDPLNFS